MARLRRAGATCTIIIRFDSGYWSNDTLAVLGRPGVSLTMAVRTGTKAIDACIFADRRRPQATLWPTGGISLS